MSPTPAKRKKATRPTRRAGVSEVLPGIGGVFQESYRMGRGIASSLDPLEAQLLASTLLAMWDLPLIEVDDAVDLVGRRFVDHLAAKRSPDALAMLLGLAAIAPDGIAEAARLAARRLRLTRVEAPAWADAPTESHAVRTWSASDPYGDQDVLVADFERDGYPAFCISALIDHNMGGGLLKDLYLSHDPEEVRTVWHEVSHMPIRDVPIQEYVDRIHDALAAGDLARYRPAAPDEPDTRPFLRAQLRHLPTPRPRTRTEVSEASRTQLLRDFRRSAHGRPLGDDADMAADLIRYAADDGGGDPLRWSPVVVEICLLGWFPRMVMLDAERIARIPDVVRAWVRFAGERKGLTAPDVAETVAAIAEFEAEFAAAMGDHTHFGPAEAIISAMLAEGVPLTDQASLDAWLEDFNARPSAERDRVIGHLRLPPEIVARLLDPDARGGPGGERSPDHGAAPAPRRGRPEPPT